MCKRIAIILFLQLLATVTIAQGFYGSVQVIPKKIQQQMTGYTWHKGCPLPLSTMRYLTITYYGFDHKDHIGHMVILDQLALETLKIFQSLYQHKFPIERMILPYHYKSTNDSPSTTADNTVGYFCRSDAQTPNKYSSHSYGISIDINPRYNPAAISKNKQVSRDARDRFSPSLA